MVLEIIIETGIRSIVYYNLTVVLLEDLRELYAGFDMSESGDNNTDAGWTLQVWISN